MRAHNHRLYAHSNRMPKLVRPHSQVTPTSCLFFFGIGMDRSKRRQRQSLRESPRFLPPQFIPLPLRRVSVSVAPISSLPGKAGPNPRRKGGLHGLLR
jgi:hypothetical protein